MDDRGLDIRPRQLQQFVALAESGSVGRAAEALAITPRALTRCVRDLESVTGERLIAGGERDVRLSPAGDEFASSARRVLVAIDRFTALARGDHGTLQVAHVPAADTLVHVLDQIARSDPSVKVRERSAAGDHPLEELIAHKLDVAVCCVDEPIPAGLASTTVRIDPLVALVDPLSLGPEPLDVGKSRVLAPVFGSQRREVDQAIDELESCTGAAVQRVPVPTGSGHELTTLLRAARGSIVVVPSSTAGLTPHFAHHPIANAPTLTWRLVHRADDHSPSLETAVIAAVRVAHRRDWLASPEA